MKTKKTLNLIALSFALLLSFSLIFAQSNQATKIFSKAEIEQHKIKFINNYNFNCEGECIYNENNQNQGVLQIKNQRKFLFWNIDLKESYTINEYGKIVQAKHNFWSRLLNREKLKVEDS